MKCGHLTLDGGRCKNVRGSCRYHKSSPKLRRSSPKRHNLRMRMKGVSADIRATLRDKFHGNEDMVDEVVKHMPDMELHLQPHTSRVRGYMLYGGKRFNIDEELDPLLYRHLSPGDIDGLFNFVEAIVNNYPENRTHNFEPYKILWKYSASPPIGGRPVIRMVIFIKADELDISNTGKPYKLILDGVRA